MKTLLAISAMLISAAALAKTTTTSASKGSYIIITEGTPGNYREMVAGRSGPFLKIDCNGGEGYGEEADIKLVSGESVRLKDANGNFHQVNCK